MTIVSIYLLRFLRLWPECIIWIWEITERRLLRLTLKFMEHTYILFRYQARRILNFVVHSYSPYNWTRTFSVVIFLIHDNLYIIFCIYRTEINRA